MSQTFVPYLAYADAAAAMTFLESAFGFIRSLEYPDEHGSIQHAEMQYGSGAIMLGTGADQQRDPAKLTIPPGRGIYIIVTDVDAHHARAAAAGAKIVWPPEDTPFGTRRYRALDPEGYEWSFGTYAPQTAI
jgi:uncharacterized glyoxalase superfamily protein PhnB